MANLVSSSQERYLGRVKWFNNKAGFGFVTCLDGDRKEEDVFVHHTGVFVASEQYKYLVQGEYVHFSIKKTENTEHPCQATDVRKLTIKIKKEEPKVVEAAVDLVKVLMTIGLWKNNNIAETKMQIILNK